MADTRINALSTATSSVSDDYVPIDGTTNGTRKLSAYSPTFGGNATVGGTLTVSGASVFQGAEGVTTGVTSSFASSVTNAITGDVLYWGSASRGGLLRGYHDGGGTVQWQFGRYTASAFAEYLRLSGATAANAVLTIYGTTASTSTSTGALVVGNGTSGGLGVGGAIWAGGKVHAGSAGYVDGGAKLNVYATPSDAGYLYGIRLSDNSTATLALGLQTPTGTTSSFIHSNIALGFGTVGVAALNINTSQQVQVLATTASTTTSSGALVVSGGVGVAGAIYAANLGGTSTNNNAASGCIGEYTSATTAYASKVSLTSNTAANIVSISLTAGDWDVQFNPVFTQDTPLTTSGLLAGVSSSSATLPSGAAERAHSPSGPNGNSDISIAPPVTRISLASTTTIYGVATGIFSAGTMSAYGFIRARRVR